MHLAFLWACVFVSATGNWDFIADQQPNQHLILLQLLVAVTVAADVAVAASATDACGTQLPDHCLLQVLGHWTCFRDTHHHLQQRHHSCCLYFIDIFPPKPSAKVHRQLTSPDVLILRQQPQRVFETLEPTSTLTSSSGLALGGKCIRLLGKKIISEVLRLVMPCHDKLYFFQCTFD